MGDTVSVVDEITFLQVNVVAWLKTGSFKFCKVTGKVLPSHQAEANRAKNLKCSRSTAVPVPMIIHDNVEVQSMADGLWYSSKSNLRKSYKSHGVVELGNERPKPKTTINPDAVRKSVRHSVRKAASQKGFETA